MGPKGSRMNPYTMGEFNAMVLSNSWLGGWTDDNGELVYRTQLLETCTSEGTTSSPFPETVFDEMFQSGIWTGGWVQKSVLKYCSAAGIEYDSSLGESGNPCPMSIFNEMAMNGIWRGGWVQKPEESVFVRNFSVSFNSGEGCGSGSDGGGNGCGSGSGSGSYSGGCEGCGCEEPSGLRSPISEGNDTPGIVRLATKYNQYIDIGDLIISWTAGNTVGQAGLAVVSVSINFYNSVSPCTFLNNNICTNWKDAYEVSISGAFTIRVNDTEFRYNIDGDYSIPARYRQASQE